MVPEHCSTLTLVCQETRFPNRHVAAHSRWIESALADDWRCSMEEKSTLTKAQEQLTKPATKVQGANEKSAGE